MKIAAIVYFYQVNVHMIDVPRSQSVEENYPPPMTGPRRASVRRLFYNQSTARCETFHYGGCKGNANNFRKRVDCRRICESICLSGGDPCLNAKCGVNAHCIKGQCECYVGFSGDPYAICRPKEIQGEDVCSQPKVTGPCRASIQRYAFDTYTGRCEMFYYGGCQGNGNNFETLEDCQQRCESNTNRGQSSSTNQRGM
ncbi:unnamed protein product [Hymenolepis diminuta]|uniref:Kunitz/Bovine pancreatic trypsin inhibitor domain protein n=1 Tax=Hymenolepis diminuta TaxID=6216 RepID=A0A0R3S8R3_HYMDI|nr:unnamed protein product [Hymenolepis diminuta]